MVKSYIVVAFRNLLKHKGYSAVNIVGLAIGMAGFLLIMCYVQHELSYDQFYPDADRIYRVIKEVRPQGSEAYFKLETPGAVASILENEYPEVERAVRVRKSNAAFDYKGTALSHRVDLVEDTFFEMFQLPFVKGDPKQAFQKPWSIVVTERVAKKIFGDTNPIGQKLGIDVRFWKGEFTVTGVLKDLPLNTTFQIEFLHATVGNHGFVKYQWHDWMDPSGSSQTLVYVKLKPDVDSDVFAEKIADLRAQHREQESMANILHLQPFLESHLYTYRDYGIATEGSFYDVERDGNMGTQGDIQQVYLFGVLGFALIGIACINFMNLTTARSTHRMREVGMRKVVGASRGRLMGQFYGESLCVALTSLPLTLILAWVLLPVVGNTVGRQLSLDFADPTQFLMLVGIVVAVGLLGGTYPALVLSAFKPVDVLKGDMQTRKSGGLRKLLVIAQFACAIALLVGTITIHRQMSYIQNRKLGFKKDHVIVTPIMRAHRNAQSRSGVNLSTRNTQVKAAFLKHPDIDAAATYMSPIGIGSDMNQVRDVETGNAIGMTIHGVDEDYVPFFEMELVQGRNFSADIASDRTDAFIVNETAVKKYGWTDPIGKSVVYGSGNWEREGVVIGVVKDFHTGSLRDAISPLGLYIRPFGYSYVALKVKSEHMSETMDFMAETWKSYVPNRPFMFYFLDDQIDALYHKEKQQGQLFTGFSLLAIMVACIGLFALASYHVEQRTKEIGVRKILGASVGQIVVLIFKDFAGLILIANLIAWPLAYYTMHDWLSQFVYRTEMGIEVFLLSAVVALLIAVVAVGYQTLRAATANPVEALRYE